VAAEVRSRSSVRPGGGIGRGTRLWAGVYTILATLGSALPQQPPSKDNAPRLNVRAERGLGGAQGDGWQHIALRIENSSGQPVSGRATLFEWESEVGVRPRVETPFTVADRVVVHFYPFRPPEKPQPSSYVITLNDDDGRPIAFDGGSQFVIGGQSTRAIRVDMGNVPTGDFRIALWGDSSAFMRGLIGEWIPSFDEITRGEEAGSLRAVQRLARSRGRINPDAIALEEPRMFPDSYLGYAGIDLLGVCGPDLEQLTERQRRAIQDWVSGGGMLLVTPQKSQQLGSPFLRDLIGLQSRGEVTTEDDRHLRIHPDSVGAPHRIVHFLTALDPPRALDVHTLYESQPVVYSVPAGFGRVWIVGFDADAHGGFRRYKPLWIDILNRAAAYRLTQAIVPPIQTAQEWSVDSDRKSLAVLGERFGKAPSVEHLAILIFGYLLIIGPANFLILKRREWRIWLIGTVPFLAALFGGVVLSMGYVSHGVRSATNYLGLGMVTPEGDRAYAEEYVGVYGTTSAEYRIDFPRHLAVRPVNEYVPNPNGGFDNPGSFLLQVRDDRQWLRDWRLTFWQLRGTTSVDCVPLNGRLTARRSGEELTISNQTDLAFENIILLKDGVRQIGPMGAFESKTVDVGPSDGSRGSPQEDVWKGRGGAAKAADPVAAEAAEASWSDAESRAIFEVAVNRVRARGIDWVFGITRKQIHPVRSPDTSRQLVATVYAWPISKDY
jgi:hypothetical protein